MASTETKAMLPGPWTWRDFGNGLGLYTAHSGAKVVLAASMGPVGGRIMARGEDGVLEPLTPEHPVARVVEAAPGLLVLAEQAVAGYTQAGYVEPCVIDGLRAAIAKARGTDG